MKVYVLHRNVEYEFGIVVGVFVSAQDAINHAATMDQGDELTVTEWTPAKTVPEQMEREVWAIYRGEVRAEGLPE